MIFLFFGTSLAHLEAELQHFKERSIFARICWWSKAPKKKMLENRPEDALVLLVETVEIV